MSEMVIIGGREFRVGAVYAPRVHKPGVTGLDRAFRGLMPNGASVKYLRLLKSGDWSGAWSCSQGQWLDWVGGPVEP